jgi:hypothetical protein
MLMNVRLRTMARLLGLRMRVRFNFCRHCLCATQLRLTLAHVLALGG